LARNANSHAHIVIETRLGNSISWPEVLLGAMICENDLFYRKSGNLDGDSKDTLFPLTLFDHPINYQFRKETSYAQKHSATILPLLAPLTQLLLHKLQSIGTSNPTEAQFHRTLDQTACDSFHYC
jgi:hypothetical protein